VNENLRRALEALEQGAAEARSVSSRSAGHLKDHLQRTVEQVLDHLEAADREPDGDDIMSRLDRQSRDIAEDLRRAEQLMKKRTGRE
jgi:hypothetical protein